MNHVEALSFDATWTYRCVVPDGQELHEPDTVPQGEPPPPLEHSHPIVTDAGMLLGKTALTAVWIPLVSVGNVMAYCPPARTAALSSAYCSIAMPMSKAASKSVTTMPETRANSRAVEPPWSTIGPFSVCRAGCCGIRSTAEKHCLGLRHRVPIGATAASEAARIQVHSVGDQNST